jgi:hypothetical protein
MNESTASGTNTNGSNRTGTATNGAAPPNGSASGPQVARAEEIVDRLAARAAEVTSVWGRRLLRAASRIREEAEDVWAEAQSIRRGEQP